MGIMSLIWIGLYCIEAHIDHRLTDVTENDENLSHIENLKVENWLID